MIFRPITSIMYGRKRSRTLGGPAIEKMRAPADATRLVPNTGDAMKVVPRRSNRSEDLAQVQG